MSLSFNATLNSISLYLENRFSQPISLQQKKVALIALSTFGLVIGGILISRHCFYSNLYASQEKFLDKQNNFVESPLLGRQMSNDFPKEEGVDFSLVSKNKVQICQSLSPAAAQAMSLCPELIIGNHHLFQWNELKKEISLSSPFQDLLQLLVELETLETKDIHTLSDLNNVLQKPQGEGGLLRKPKFERWEMTDHPIWKQRKAVLEHLFTQLGFIQSHQLVKTPILVKHCIIFGARAERIETRIKETLQFFLKGDVQAEHIFILGSKRKLIPEERLFLSKKIESFHQEKQKIYWQEILANEEYATEANACALLWEYLLPKDLKEKLEGKVVFVQSTRLGSSYQEQAGNRTTTDITTDDWNSYYQDGEKQAIFALAEQPYGRLLDQLRASVLTKAKRATLDLVMQRIALTTFYFVQPQLKKDSLAIGIVLDEIARNVYRTIDILRYFEQVQQL